MRYKHPKSLGGYQGGYGGMGSKPAPETWGPGTGKTSRVKRLVPKKLRGIRLRSRSKRGRGEGTPPKRPEVYMVIGLVLMLASPLALIMRVADWGPGAPGGLLFFVLCGVGGGFLGRGVSGLLAKKRASLAGRRLGKHRPSSALDFLIVSLRDWSILLGCVVAFYCIEPSLWGPMTFPKTVLAVAIVIGLAIALDVGNPVVHGRDAARGYEPGRHAARAGGWNLKRRLAAIATGIVLFVISILQFVEPRDPLEFHPLQSGLCLMLGLAAGLSLVAVGLTSRGVPPRVDPIEDPAGDAERKP